MGPNTASAEMRRADNSQMGLFLAGPSQVARSQKLGLVSGDLERQKSRTEEGGRALKSTATEPRLAAALGGSFAEEER